MNHSLDFPIDDLIFRTIKNISTCKYLYRSSLDGAVLYTARQMSVSPNSGQVAKASEKVAELIANDENFFPPSSLKKV